jgi:hypothetical protein
MNIFLYIFLSENERVKMPINTNTTIGEISESLKKKDMPNAYLLLFGYLEGKISFEKCVALVDAISEQNVPTYCYDDAALDNIIELINRHYTTTAKDDLVKITGLCRYRAGICVETVYQYINNKKNNDAYGYEHKPREMLKRVIDEQKARPAVSYNDASLDKVIDLLVGLYYSTAQEFLVGITGLNLYRAGICLNVTHDYIKAHPKKLLSVYRNILTENITKHLNIMQGV